MNEMHYHRVAGQFYNRPLWLLPSAAETISAFLLSRIQGGPLAGRGGSGDSDEGGSTQAFHPTPHPDGSAEFHKPRASRFYGEYPVDEDARGRPKPYRRTAEGTAIITVVGELVNRGAYVGASSGVVSYEGIKFQLLQAAADERTKNILLDIESPGGEAVGAFEVAAIVRQVRAEKPVVAVVNGLAASAGYALASGASRIVTMPTGISGSIGVVMLHLDFSKFLATAGVKPTFIFAGANKVDANQYEPLPDDVRERLQTEIDSFYEQFVETVAAGRKSLKPPMIKDTEARVFKGQDALDVGLADEVGTFEEVLADLSRGSGRLTPSNQGRPKMDKQVGDPGAATPGVLKVEQTAAAPPAPPAPPAPAAAKTDTVADLAAAYPALVAQVRTEAATAERERILGIEKSAGGGAAALHATCQADGKTTPEQAAMQILQAEKGMRGKHLAAIQGVEKEGAKVPAAPTANTSTKDSQSTKATTPEGWKAEYEAQDAKGEALRQEFPDAAGYIAYMKAESSGKVRRLVNRVAS
jgi:signal peptide peptidase SppA